MASLACCAQQRERCDIPRLCPMHTECSSALRLIACFLNRMQAVPCGMACWRSNCPRGIVPTVSAGCSLGAACKRNRSWQHPSRQCTSSPGMARWDLLLFAQCTRVQRCHRAREAMAATDQDGSCIYVCPCIREILFCRSATYGPACSSQRVGVTLPQEAGCDHRQGSIQHDVVVWGSSFRVVDILVGRR